MNQQPIDQARDSDLRLSATALQRAALRAREIARQTGTTIVISRNGIVEHLQPWQESGSAPGVSEPPSDYNKTNP